MEKIKIAGDDGICFISSRYLHRYLTINEDFKESLSQNYLWFSDPLKFNDPYDCNMEVNFNCTYEEVLEYLNQVNVKRNLRQSDEFLQQRAKSLSTNVNEMESLSKSVDSETISGIGICCLSQKDNSLLMWSHYADKHQGACLVFDITKDKDLFGRQLFNLEYPYKYPSHRFPADYGKYKALRFLIATKSKEWEYEDEIRVVRDKKNISFRGKVNFKKESLQGIKFGYKCPLQEREDINELLIKTGDYEHVKFYATILKKGEFGVDFREVER